MPTPRLPLCLGLSLLGAGLVLPTPSRAATWPTIDQVLGSAQPGDWVRYRQVQNQGGQTLRTTLWISLQSRDAKVFQTQLVLSPTLSEGPPPAAGGTTKVQLEKLATGSPFLGLPLPPGLQVLEDTVTESPYQDLMLSGKKYSGTLTRHSRKLKLPTGQTMNFEASLWRSEDVPTTGVAKYQMSMSGMGSASQTLEVLASKQSEEAAQAEAAAEQAFQTPAELYQLAEKLFRRSYGMQDKSRTPNLWEGGDINSFFHLLAKAHLAADRPEDALRAMEVRDQAKQAGEVVTALRQQAAQRGDDAGLIRLGVSKDRLDSEKPHLVVQALTQSQDQASFSKVKAYLEKLPAGSERSSGAYTALGASKGWNGKQLRTLLAFLPGDKERKSWLEGRFFGAQTGTLSQAELETLAKAHPPLAASAGFLAARARILLREGKTAPARALVEEYLTTAKEGRSDHEAGLLLAELRDPRSASYLRKAAASRLQELTQSLAGRSVESLNSFEAADLCRARASTGDAQGALAVLPEKERNALPKQFEVMVWLYGVGGKPSEALAWRDRLDLASAAKEKGYGFLLPGFRAEAQIELARWEWSQGNDAKARQFLRLGMADGQAANAALIAANQGRNSSDSRFWQGNFSRLRNDPHYYVLKALLELPLPEADSWVLEYLRGLKDEFPASGAYRTAWEQVMEAYSKRTDPKAFLEAIRFLPQNLERNWLTAVLRTSLARVAPRLDLATLRSCLQIFQDHEVRAEVLRAYLVALAEIPGRLKDMEALFPELEVEVEAKASRGHRDAGTVALARARMAAGDYEGARKAFLDRKGDLREWSPPIRGVGGKHWTGYLFDLSWELGKATGKMDVLRSWLQDSPREYERAVLALGFAAGLEARR